MKISAFVLALAAVPNIAAFVPAPTKLIYCLTTILSSMAPSVAGKKLRGNIGEKSFIMDQAVTPRIVGGSDVSAGTYVWYSGLYRPFGAQFFFFCGGQLVDKDFGLSVVFSSAILFFTMP